MGPRQVSRILRCALILRPQDFPSGAKPRPMVKFVSSIALSSYSHFYNPESIASSSLMESIMWTCIICSITITVTDEPSHLATNDHITHLWDFNARVLASCSEELTLLCTTPDEQSPSFVSMPLGFQGVEHVSTEKSTRWRIWSDPEFASLTIPTEIKPTHTTPSRLSSTSAALWICKVCDRMMHEGLKSDHLAGKAHAQKLMFKSSILPDPPHDISTKPVIPVKTTLTCPSCKAVFTIHEKTHLRCVNRQVLCFGQFKGRTSALGAAQAVITQCMYHLLILQDQ